MNENKSSGTLKAILIGVSVTVIGGLLLNKLSGPVDTSDNVKSEPKDSTSPEQPEVLTIQYSIYATYDEPRMSKKTIPQYIHPLNNRFVTAHMLINNQCDAAIFMKPESFRLTLSQGQIHSDSYNYGFVNGDTIEGILKRGYLKMDSSLEALLVFKVPTNKGIPVTAENLNLFLLDSSGYKIDIIKN